MTERDRFEDTNIEKWMRRRPILEVFPRDWEVKELSEDDTDINPDSWKLGQVGMITVNGKTVIKPAYQDGVKPGEVRVIFLSKIQTLDSQSYPEDELR